MTNEQQELWRKIAEFSLDRTDVPLPFSRRLARENGWSPTYTRRVLDEYRRFLFLAIAAGHPVSPPEAVDEAWHLHLLYTESYWTDLCQDTLGRPIHHSPTRGGAAESAKFEDWYGRTLASYCRLFEVEPPADIWPATHHRPKLEAPVIADAGFWVVHLRKLPPGLWAVPVVLGGAGRAGRRGIAAHWRGGRCGRFVPRSRGAPPLAATLGPVRDDRYAG